MSCISSLFSACLKRQTVLRMEIKMPRLRQEIVPVVCQERIRAAIVKLFLRQMKNHLPMPQTQAKRRSKKLRTNERYTKNIRTFFVCDPSPEKNDSGGIDLHARFLRLFLPV